jgi:hypothetical protein
MVSLNAAGDAGGAAKTFRRGRFLSLDGDRGRFQHFNQANRRAVVALGMTVTAGGALAMAVDVI